MELVRVPDAAGHAIEGAGLQREDHEGLPVVLKVNGVLAGGPEAEARVVARVAREPNDAVSLRAQRREAGLQQPPADTLPLVRRCHGERPEADGRMGNIAGLDRHRREQDMTHHLAVALGDEREQDFARFTKGFDETGFHIAAEGLTLDTKHGLTVGGGLGTDREQTTTGRWRRRSS